MKKAYLSILLFFLFVLIAQGQTTSQTVELSDPGSWSVVILPDVQTYVKIERNQPILDLMMLWIKDNIDRLNIKMVLSTGDLVEHNDRIDPDGIRFDQPSKLQWEAVSRSFEKLNGIVPYITATGNHDYTIADMQKKNSLFNEYFPVDKNFLNRKLLHEAAPNTEGFQTLENAAFEMITPHGDKYLFVTLEFCPRDTIVAWAKQLTVKTKYSDYRIVLLTHSYLSHDDTRIAGSGYAIADKNEGEDIWQKLIRPAQNIELVICGHIAAPDDFSKHTGFRADNNDHGRKVNQMLFNAQALGGGWHGNGGDGWLRVLEFMPDGKTVKVKTFSPLFAISPSTRHLALQQEIYNEFEFEFDK